MNNYWGAMITGALIGAAATYYFINNEDKITGAVSRIKSQSEEALNCFRDMEEEAEDLV
ncbi:MAG: hypothetical protein PHU36_00360 [Syntrophomonadaceae bacterium]|nr:hypothetical protein [Syntrophomonadaceae bacterium]